MRAQLGQHGTAPGRPVAEATPSDAIELLAWVPADAKTHCEIYKHYQRTSKAHAEVLQDVMVSRMQPCHARSQAAESASLISGMRLRRPCVGRQLLILKATSESGLGISTLKLLEEPACQTALASPVRLLQLL